MSKENKYHETAFSFDKKMSKENKYHETAFSYEPVVYKEDDACDAKIGDIVFTKTFDSELTFGFLSHDLNGTSLIIYDLQINNITRKYKFKYADYKPVTRDVKFELINSVDQIQKDYKIYMKIHLFLLNVEINKYARSFEHTISSIFDK